MCKFRRRVIRRLRTRAIYPGPKPDVKLAAVGAATANASLGCRCLQAQRRTRAPADGGKDQGLDPAPDTSSGVICQRGKRPLPAAPPEPVSDSERRIGVGARSPHKAAHLENLRDAFRYGPDPRAAPNRRHPLAALLGVIALGLLRGARDVLDRRRQLAGPSQRQRQARGPGVRDKSTAGGSRCPATTPATTNSEPSPPPPASGRTPPLCRPATPPSRPGWPARGHWQMRHDRHALPPRGRTSRRHDGCPR